MRGRGNPRPALRGPGLSEDPRLGGDPEPGPQKTTGTPARPSGDPTPGPRETPGHSRPLHPDGLRHPLPPASLPPTPCPPLTLSPREPDGAFIHTYTRAHTLIVPRRPLSRLRLPRTPLPAPWLENSLSPSPGSSPAPVPGIPRTPNLRGPPSPPRGAPVPESQGVPPSWFPSILPLPPTR